MAEFVERHSTLSSHRPVLLPVEFMFARRALTLCLVLLPMSALADDEEDSSFDEAAWWKQCERRVTIQEGGNQVVQFKKPFRSIACGSSLDVTAIGGNRLLVRGVDAGWLVATVFFGDDSRSRVCVKVTPAPKMPTPQPDRPVPSCEGADKSAGATVVSLDLRLGEIRPFAVADWRGVTATPPGIVEVSSRDANHLLVAGSSIGQTSLLICRGNKLTLLAIRVSEEGGPEHQLRDLVENKARELRQDPPNNR